jgi:hypothetical protein
LIPAVVADTGGLLRALARTPEGKASFPDYREILISASAVIAAHVARYPLRVHLISVLNPPISERTISHG